MLAQTHKKQQYHGLICTHTTDKIVYDHGKHQERKKHEVLIGYFTSVFFNKYIEWCTKRIVGPGFYTKRLNDIVYPVFVNREEIIKKGWLVGRLRTKWL